MEDRRIQKTKRKLKESFVELISEKPFKSITVKELCDRADITRVTFYTYYKNKYELSEEYFADMVVEVRDSFQELQTKSNPEDFVVEGYLNMLDALLDLYTARQAFFKHATPKENPYLSSYNYVSVLRSVSLFTARYAVTYKPRYPVRAIASFITNGLWGFITDAVAEGLPQDQIREDAKSLLRDILESKAFIISGAASGDTEKAICR